MSDEWRDRVFRTDRPALASSGRSRSPTKALFGAAIAARPPGFDLGRAARHDHDSPAIGLDGGVSRLF